MMAPKELDSRTAFQILTAEAADVSSDGTIHLRIAIWIRCRYHQHRLARIHAVGKRFIIAVFDTYTSEDALPSELKAIREARGRDKLPLGLRLHFWWLEDFPGSAGWCPSCQRRREITPDHVREAIGKWRRKTGKVTITV